MGKNSFNRQDVANSCRKYGPQLQVDPPLNGVQVMWGLSGNESSFGRDCGPRHEPAYDTQGSIGMNNALQKQLLSEFGSSAASSYGPWQMMFINFVGATPDQLLTDLDLLAQEFVRFFNSYVVQTRKARTLSDIGQVWNSGHVSTEPAPGVQAYVNRLTQNYQAQLPSQGDTDGQASAG